MYVDDLAIASKDPKFITATLTDFHGYKLKGVGPMTYHLGCDFFRDKDGTLAFGPKTYIAKLMDAFQNMFNTTPKEYTAPLEKNDHPELDDSGLLPPNDNKK